MNIKKIKLPSNGLITGVPEEVTIRGMKGSELSMVYSNFNDEALDELIKAVVKDEDVDTELFTDKDKHIILHATRVLTFGNITTQSLKCPVCGQIHEYDINYDNFDTVYLDKEYIENNLIKIGEHTYERRVPTSRDYAELRAFRDKFNISITDDFILMQMAFIATLDNKKVANTRLLNHLKDLPGKDLFELSRKLEVKYGYDTSFNVDCKQCKNTIPGVLGITPNLFR